MDEPELGVLLLDDRRVFVAANHVAAALLGVTETELIGRRADEFMPLIARPLYPLAWQGFLVRGHASGEYAAQRTDESLSHLHYVGFANRPIRGLHFFLIEAIPGDLSAEALLPARQGSYIQVGLQLPEDVRLRLVREADREEWRLPVSKGSQRAVLAALFDRPEQALDALDALRDLGSIEASIATAAGGTSEVPLTLLAGRVPYVIVGQAIEGIRERGGRIMSNVDERWTQRPT
jgi:hypothetical protein